MTDLEREIAAVINRHSLENGSNTPDFLLAQFLLDCLEAFNRAMQERERWNGRPIPGMPKPMPLP